MNQRVKRFVKAIVKAIVPENDFATIDYINLENFYFTEHILTYFISNWFNYLIKLNLGIIYLN